MKILSVLVLLTLYQVVYGQKTINWIIQFGFNQTIPNGNDGQTIFPVIGYNKETSPKLLIGGLQAGTSAHGIFSDRLRWSASGMLARHTSWQQPLILTDQNGANIGIHEFNKVDYVVKLLPAIQWKAVNQLFLGMGFGAHLTLFTIEPTPDFILNGTEQNAGLETMSWNKLVVPVIPISIDWMSQKKLSFHFRYEWLPLNLYNRALNSKLESRPVYIHAGLGIRIGKDNLN